MRPSKVSGRTRSPASYAALRNSTVARSERKAPRLSDLKRALRWLRAQYQRRAEEATSTHDRMIERIRKAKAKKVTY